MDVIEAILSRHSVRDFSSQPVPEETVMKILEAALRSPSGGNSQPWEVFVAAGATLDRIRKVYKERSQSGAGAPAGPPPLPAKYQERMATIRNERLQLLGLDPADPASGKVFSEWQARLFGAQVVVVVCMDKALPASKSLDIGTFVQSVCLAALDCGVDSFIAGMLVSHPDVLQQELEIPESLDIMIGIALGYPNPDSVINTYHSPRRPIREVVRYKS
ncbi:MAG: nitroreductase [Acidobacteria bacterium]|nr:nitroreductase [Acidobacteriota bacterium]